MLNRTVYFATNPSPALQIERIELSLVLPHAISMLRILMSSIGFSLYVLTFSILWITSKPCTARPKMVCLLSSQG